nr:CARDB domain-containing protein [Methanosarcina horonobensis]
MSQGESSYFSYDRITLPGDSVEIKAVVDKDNLIRESDEENNEKQLP